MQTATRLERDAGNRSRVLLLSQLPAPIRFFGLLLLVVEASFGAYLTIARPIERVVLTFGYLMGILFLIATVAVTFLTVKTPAVLMQDENDSESEFAERARRVRIAFKLMLRYLESNNKNREAVVDLLAKVETVLWPSKKRSKSLTTALKVKRV